MAHHRPEFCPQGFSDHLTLFTTVGILMTDAATATGQRNWAGNYVYRASRIHRPTTIDEIAAIAQSAISIRVLGSRHSFTDIVDADELIDLSNYEPRAHFDADAQTITVPASTTYGEVAQSLTPHGMALRNLASLPHISVAGSVATATHGSGTGNGNLATSVAGFEYVNTAGEIISVDRSTPDFDGMVVSLGALGIVTTVSLDVIFDYQIEQHVYGDLPLDVVVDQLAMILGAAYSVSVFSTFAGSIDGQVGQVWIKRRTDGSDRSMHPGATFLDAPAATMQHHPIPGVDGSTCTAQLGVPGPWADRLPHFRMGFTPSAGNEVQSEFFVGSVDGPLALEALRNAADDFADRLMVGEIRAVAAGECGVALANSYYIARLMRSDKAEDRKVMASVGIVWPNQATTGTHVNISGGGMLKNAPHKQAAVKFLEYLASDQAQIYFADGNNEWPVVTGVKISNPALEQMGKFKPESLNVGVLAKNQNEVQKIYDRAGWQ